MADGEISGSEVFSEDSDTEHWVDPELLELYEILEYTGKIAPNYPKGAAPRAAILLAASPPGTVVSRGAWGARAPRSAAPLLRAPRGSTAHYEGPYMGPFSHDRCPAKVRGIQAFHMDSRRWSDIAYTSMECPHGLIFMGRGWNARTAANGTNIGNDQHYAHCVLMGQGDPFTDEAKVALSIAFNLARTAGFAGAEQKVHSDWKATACPGDPIRSFVRAGLPIGPPPVPPAPEDDTMIYSEIVTIPAPEGLPDGRVRQLATLRGAILEANKVSNISVRCQDGGVVSNAICQKTEYAGVLVLSFRALGNGPAPQGNVWVDVTYVN